ncbi:hypothetical protein D3C87_2060740 [compost metagenome]
MESLSKSAQEAAGATDEVSRAADELNAQAEALREAIGFFKTGAQVSGSQLSVSLDRAPKPLALPTRV